MLKTKNTCLVVIDLQERLVPALHEKEDLLKRCSAFIKGMKLLEIPVLVTQQYTKGLGATVLQISEALGDFQPIEKITFSCMADEAFKTKLSGLGAKNLVVVGAEAHICVQQTVLDMLQEKRSVYLAADCVGSRFMTDKQCAIERMKCAGATISTLESILFELLQTAEHPCRKQIQALIMDF